MGLELTNDASAFVAVLYREYSNRRKQGKSIDESMYMGDDVEIKEKLTPKLLLDDITHLCWYLQENEILYVEPGDDRANSVSITDAGIAFMERRFPKGIEDAISFIGKIVALVPWLA